MLSLKLNGTRTVLVFENAHWIDSSSLRLIRTAMAEVQPLLVLLTQRPAGSEQKGAALIESSAAYELKGLAADQVTEMLCSTLRVPEVPSPVSRLITERGRGSSLWTLELTRTMLETEVISTEEGKLQLLKDLDSVVFPSTAEQLITARLDQLPAAEGLSVKVGLDGSPARLITDCATNDPLPTTREHARARAPAPLLGRARHLAMRGHACRC